MVLSKKEKRKCKKFHTNNHISSKKKIYKMNGMLDWVTGELKGKFAKLI